MATEILVIDDDTDLLRLLKEYLSRFGMEVVAASRPEQGLALLKSHRPAAVVLDLMLPGMDGFEVCRRIRERWDLPVLMLTARGEVSDRVAGLEVGADDYIPKPFEPRELVARLRSVLRRSRLAPDKKSAALLCSGRLSLDLAARRADLDGKTLDLSSGEFDLLALFMKNPGQVLDREKILDELRGAHYEAYDRSVDLAVSRLRAKLKDPSSRPRLLKTVWGTGYQFTGKVTRKEPK
jgi:DNA-binding response OmpR family regulator